MSNTDEQTGAEDLQKYFKKIGDYELKQLARKGVGWFLGKISELRKVVVKPRKFIISEDVTKKLTIGRVYLFQYKPKYKDTLPVWDEFPLVLPFQATPTGFIGINLHYLPYSMRALLLYNLTKINPTATEKKKMSVSWEILSNMAKVDVGQYATHQYLLSHIASPVRVIRVEDYAKMIMLPVHKFHGDQAKRFNRQV